jgi:hypothetical protein
LDPQEQTVVGRHRCFRRRRHGLFHRPRRWPQLPPAVQPGRGVRTRPGSQGDPQQGRAPVWTARTPQSGQPSQLPSSATH